MSTEILKEHTVKEVEELLKNYKFFSITDVNGKKITLWNKPGANLKEHFKECISRFNLNIVPDGYYYFCLSQAARLNKDGADKYLVKKGNATIQANPQQFMLPQNKNDLITVEAALKYITEIAELKTKIVALESENKQLKDEIVVLEAELEESEREEEALGENKPGGGIQEFWKEQGPQIMNLADRFFEQSDKKIELEKLKIEKGIYPTNSQRTELKKRPPLKKFETGSPEHINYIKLLHSQDKDELLNKELDKLEVINPELYEQLCNELNLFEDEGNN